MSANTARGAPQASKRAPWERAILLRLTPELEADLATVAASLGPARSGRRRGRAELVRAALHELALRLGPAPGRPLIDLL